MEGESPKNGGLLFFLCLLFGVFGLMVGILLVSGVISRIVIRRLKVKRVLPSHGVVARPMAAKSYSTASRSAMPAGPGSPRRCARPASKGMHFLLR